jgi:hypothetical protein
LSSFYGDRFAYLPPNVVILARVHRQKFARGARGKKTRTSKKLRCSYEMLDYNRFMGEFCAVIRWHGPGFGNHFVSLLLV